MWLVVEGLPLQGGLAAGDLRHPLLPLPLALPDPEPSRPGCRQPPSLLPQNQGQIARAQAFPSRG